MTEDAFKSYSLQEDCVHLPTLTRGALLNHSCSQEERGRGQRGTKHDNLTNRSVYPFFGACNIKFLSTVLFSTISFSPVPSTTPSSSFSQILSRPMKPPQEHPGEGLMEPLYLLPKQHRTCVWGGHCAGRSNSRPFWTQTILCYIVSSV